jgi:hypothetical protein
MGARFRLRASFDISGYSAANQVILKALKKYGMMLSDNGSAWFLSGAPDSRWDNTDLSRLGQLHGSDFEAVDVSVLMVDVNSGQAKQSTTVSVTVSPASASVAVSGSRQFTAAVSNAPTQLVNWSVNGVSGGNSTVGLVSTSGLYTAPPVVPPGGQVTVQATSVDSPSAAGSATVTVVGGPVLSGLSPASGAQGNTVGVTLTGSGFTAGATVAVSGTGVAVSGVTVVSGSRITATFTVAASAPAGSRTVTVTTAGGTSGGQTFTVIARPTLTSLSPNAASRGTAVNVTLVGTGFSAPATVVVSGSGVTVSNIVIVDAGTITARFQLSSGAQRRSRTVTVGTAAGVSNGATFTVQ